jgi:hypothetical protein
MKYFTPALLAMGQSRDEAALNRQEELWDAACERYFQHLDALKGQMPPGLRQRVDNYYLHDATIRGMGQRGRWFIIMLQLDTPPQSLLTLTYDLVEEPVIDKTASTSAWCSTAGPVDWQYDEIERIAGELPTWAQAVLFSNGWEVSLHFHDVQVEEAQALIPVPRNGATVAPGPTVSQTA